METIEFSTGRTYDAFDTPQVLRITVESTETDEWGITWVCATFRDNARGISGRVNVVKFPNDDIGAQVLSAYDDGRYDTI